jgi:tetratricopeptide (TPR) repeat protein
MMLALQLPLLLLAAENGLGDADPAEAVGTEAKEPVDPPPPAPQEFTAEEIAVVNDLVDSAALHLKNHKVNHALTNLERATKLAPSFWRGHFLYGIALEQSYDFDHTNQEPLVHAVSQYSMAHNLEPRHFESVLNRGMAMAKLNRADEALESWHRAMRINKDDVRAPFNLGLAYKKLDPAQTSEAVHFFRQALKITPTDAKLYNAIGKAYEEATPPLLDQAAHAFLEAHRLSPQRYQDAQAHAMKLQWQAVEASDPDLVRVQNEKKGIPTEPPEPPPVKATANDRDL